MLIKIQTTYHSLFKIYDSTKIKIKSHIIIFTLLKSQIIDIMTTIYNSTIKISHTHYHSIKKLKYSYIGYYLPTDTH
ncbi:hypothetical protein TOL5_09310 [Acinetobacter sp. Tol 5]|nr:hypothetical protein TOL5_09310 [Acinetobacter sp. Tol 5]